MSGGLPSPGRSLREIPLSLRKGGAQAELGRVSGYTLGRRAGASFFPAPGSFLGFADPLTLPPLRGGPLPLSMREGFMTVLVGAARMGAQKISDLPGDTSVRRSQRRGPGSFAAVWVGAPCALACASTAAGSIWTPAFAGEVGF